MHHVMANPAILYVGTPVLLIGTENADGSSNLAPMSSAWWLGWGCMLGLNASSKTVENMRRSRACVLNLPSTDQAAAVDRIALTTGSDPVPENKRAMGFRHVADKFGLAQLTAVPAELVAAPRARECPIQMEAAVEAIEPFGASNPSIRTPMCAIELRVLRVHVDPAVLVEGAPNRIDPDKWRPLIMSFREFYGLGPRLHPSRLSEFPEDRFRPVRRPVAPHHPSFIPPVEEQP